MGYSADGNTRGESMTFWTNPKAILLVASLVGFCSSAVAAPCSDYPPEVTAYLHANPTWSVVQFSDLLKDDQALWKQSPPAQCPGFSQVDFDGTGLKYSALALFQKAKGKLIEKVVVLRREQGRIHEHTVFAAGKVPYLCVIWKAGPGKARDWEGAKEVVIPYESLVYEQMEAWAYQFYLLRGKFKYVQISG